MDEEILNFLKKHLLSIQDNDIQTYRETTAEDLTLYEWWVTPHRIDGIPFHDFMMAANAQRGTVFGAEHEGDGPAPTALTSRTCIFNAMAIRPLPVTPCWSAPPCPAACA